MYHIHLRIQRWVVWWFYVGIFCGVTALVNIFGSNLTRTQEHIILVIGVLHWLLGGLVCWALGSVRIQPGRQRPEERPRKPTQEKEWHSASDFVFPGNHRRWLPPRY